MNLLLSLPKIPFRNKMDHKHGWMVFITTLFHYFESISDGMTVLRNLGFTFTHTCYFIFIGSCEHKSRRGNVAK